MEVPVRVVLPCLEKEEKKLQGTNFKALVGYDVKSSPQLLKHVIGAN